MDVDEAIKTAIEFETRVRDQYAKAAAKAVDPDAKKVLEVLAGEEQDHLNYLHSRLHEWRKDGKLTAEQLGTVLPSKERILEGVKSLKASVSVCGVSEPGISWLQIKVRRGPR